MISENFSQKRSEWIDISSHHSNSFFLSFKAGAFIKKSPFNSSICSSTTYIFWGFLLPFTSINAPNSYRKRNASRPVSPKPIIIDVKGFFTQAFDVSTSTKFTGWFLTFFFNCNTARLDESIIWIWCFNPSHISNFWFWLFLRAWQ